VNGDHEVDPRGGGGGCAFAPGGSADAAGGADGAPTGIPSGLPRVSLGSMPALNGGAVQVEFSSPIDLQPPDVNS
jgi:hypothetical protein